MSRTLFQNQQSHQQTLLGDGDHPLEVASLNGDARNSALCRPLVTLPHHDQRSSAMYLDMGVTSKWGPGWLPSKKEPVQVVNTASPHRIGPSWTYPFTSSKHLNPNEMASRDFDKFEHRPCWMLFVCWIENMLVGVIVCFLMLAFTLRTMAFPTALPRRSNGIIQARHVPKKMWNGSCGFNSLTLFHWPQTKLKSAQDLQRLPDPTRHLHQSKLECGFEANSFFKSSLKLNYIHQIELHTSVSKSWRVQDDEDLGSHSSDFSQH